MNIVFVEPRFPDTQRRFVRALRAVGAYVMVVSEYDYDDYDDELKSWIDWHMRIGSVTNEGALEWAVRQAQGHTWVDRLECSIESHVMPVARVRERCGIPGTSARAAYLCRDKPTMKQVLREAGIPTAASTAVATTAEALEFARAVGYPLILKPRDGAGAAGTIRVADDEQLAAACAASGVDAGSSLALEEFVEGHEGFLDTITINGHVTHEFASHYFPNVLEAMRTRWISPQIIATNRVMGAEYEEVREMARRVIAVLGLDTSATHMEWFFGPKGLRFSEIGARPPGVGQWDMYNEANEMDLHYEWAHALMYGQPKHQPTRQVLLRAGRAASEPRRRDQRVLGAGRGPPQVRRSGDRVALPGSRDAHPARGGRVPRQCLDAPASRGLRHAQGDPVGRRAHGTGVGGLKPTPVR